MVHAFCLYCMLYICKWVHKSILIFKPLLGMNVRFYDISFVLEAIGDQAFQRAETLQRVSLNYLNACFLSQYPLILYWTDFNHFFKLL